MCAIQAVPPQTVPTACGVLHTCCFMAASAQLLSLFSEEEHVAYCCVQCASEVVGQRRQAATVCHVGECVPVSQRMVVIGTCLLWGSWGRCHGIARLQHPVWQCVVWTAVLCA